jgi:hypothetical protein
MECDSGGVGLTPPCQFLYAWNVAYIFLYIFIYLAVVFTDDPRPKHTSDGEYMFNELGSSITFDFVTYICNTGGMKCGIRSEYMFNDRSQAVTDINLNDFTL